MNFTVTQIIVFLIAYVCLYALIDRVMKCIEHCAMAKAYSQIISSKETDETDELYKKAVIGFKEYAEKSEGTHEKRSDKE